MVVLCLITTRLLAYLVDQRRVDWRSGHLQTRRGSMHIGSHTALGGQPPASCVSNLSGQNTELVLLST